MSYNTPEKKHYSIEEQADRLPLYLREFYQTRTLDRIKIDGTEIQGYFEYSFFEEKTYIRPPQRSSDGTIGNLDSYATFLTPRLTIKYNYMHISDYRKLMNLLYRKNEFVVECYDIVKDERVAHKMYFAPPEMPSIHQRYMEVLGIKNYTIELIGTNSDLEKVNITYHLNPPADSGVTADETIGEDDVYRGEEVIIGNVAGAIVNETFGGMYKFSKWSTNASGGEQQTFLDGYAYIINNSLVLYAQWEKMENNILTFNYGLADPEIDENTNNYVSFRKVVQGKSIGTLPSPPIPTVKHNDLDGNEKTYEPYANGKWYRTPVKTTNSIQVKSGDLYWTNRDSSIYLLYDTTAYRLYLYIDGIYYQANSVQYNAPLNLPELVKSGYVFDGWYHTSDFQEGTKYSGNMPPYSLTLYARWVKQ